MTSTVVTAAWHEVGLLMNGCPPADALSVRLIESIRTGRSPSDDGAVLLEAPTMAEALAKLQEVLASAPINMNELEALGFRFS